MLGEANPPSCSRANTINAHARLGGPRERKTWSTLCLGRGDRRRKTRKGRAEKSSREEKTKNATTKKPKGGLEARGCRSWFVSCADDCSIEGGVRRASSSHLTGGLQSAEEEKISERPVHSLCSSSWGGKSKSILRMDPITALSP